MRDGAQLSCHSQRRRFFLLISFIIKGGIWFFFLQFVGVYAQDSMVDWISDVISDIVVSISDVKVNVGLYFWYWKVFLHILHTVYSFDGLGWGQGNWSAGKYQQNRVLVSRNGVYFGDLD